MVFKAVGNFALPSQEKSQNEVNRQFRKDHEAAVARIPNPDTVVRQLDLPYSPPPGLAGPYQENPLIAQIAGMPKCGEIQSGQREEPFLSKSIRP
ncbi:unnamed protein product [Prunus armeniaca]